MLYGCCTNMLPREPGSIGEEYFETLAKLGYDYVELPLYDLAAASPQQLREAQARLRQTLPVRCCNNFFPADVRLVGRNTAPTEKVREYAKRALACAAGLGLPSRCSAAHGQSCARRIFRLKRRLSS